MNTNIQCLEQRWITLSITGEKNDVIAAILDSRYENGIIGFKGTLKKDKVNLREACGRNHAFGGTRRVR